MKKLLLSLLMIPTIHSTAFTIELHDDLCKEIVMPSKEILAKRLHEAGFGYYDEKTKISQKLGGQVKHPFGIPNLVYQTNDDFNEYMGNKPKTSAATHMRTPTLVRVLLQDYPEAIACLESLEVLAKKE